ncbi:probable ADP-ribosylation factor GTPase-activating protein AGD11 [Cryptomeria japonica]|uniref:probable ADP-ribosylation factor GTPase-activating protein AGD11 n=1 Tax=Cryptomeria japonica TaxID=3369 RepID=UPI0027DA0B08|nr:probable ADP-ribosylation factor GTPase-activating protein AGD11 [Cryptomeria japonica]
MADAVAILKLRIIKGTNLAVRDLWTSDPYVVVRLGHQKVKTRVIKKNLNPLWDEELSLFVPQSQPRVLKLEVFDKDRLSRDDHMGNGEVDLRDLENAAGMLKTNPSQSLALKNKEGSPCIKCVDGHVVQEVCLKLHNVESGQLDLHIKWVDLTDKSPILSS